MVVRVQDADFDPGAELAALSTGRTDIGAVASFTGLVRGGEVTALELEHYPGMTERALAGIEAQATARWSLDATLIIHRYGRLLPGERIVLVAAASRHRAAALEAVAFMMDFLKTDAPFWKREEGPDGGRWVDARSGDDTARDRWGAKDG
ncbi:MAG: molybdenum cofactor biosynthesis protein MoaE [Pseudomonadota bacterium]